MSQTLFIALLVLVVAIFVFLYRRKKKVENKMGDELNALIESDDWQGVCRILRKQLVIWGCVLVLVVGLIVARFTMGEHTVNPIDDFDFADGSNIYLVEVPVKEPWQVFAYIPFGGWNECPDADEQMAVAKYWYEKYGAVAANFSNDMIQYYVPKPVTDDTMSVAEEHMGYCEDAVLQGDNLTTLAATIKESTVWTFWWD